MRLHTVVPLAVASLLLSAVPIAAQISPAPSLINFQAKLTTAGGAALPDGSNYTITVSLWDAATGGNQKWSQTLNNVTVQKGVFSALLTADTPGLFNATNLWLEVAVLGDPAMTPRTQLASVPFALKANSVADGSIGAAQLAVGLQGWLLGGNGATNPATNFLGTTDGQPLVLRTNGVERARLDAAGRLGLGTASPGLSLEVSTPSYYGSPALGVSNGGKWLYLHGSTGDHSLIWNTGSALRFGMETSRGSGYGEVARIGSNGYLGIGTTTPGFPITFPDTLGDKISLYGQSGDSFGFGIAPSTLQIHANNSASDVAFGYGSSAAMTETMRVAGSGFVSIASGLNIGGAPPYSNITNYVKTNPNSYSFWGTDGNSALIAWHGTNAVYFGTETNTPLYLQTNNGAQAVLTTDGKLGIGTFNPAYTLDVNGTAQVKVVRILGGADVAEPFNVRETKAAGKPEPGMVVCIDPEKAGDLRLAGRPYDRTVAGIISGAGGIQPGMTLSQAGTDADGKHPVALSGRVWCYCDADANGPIAPGDLLTTSSTPGHAMRATDSSRSQGAVLGKAMSRLASGKGLVLVLVTLQ